jgi:hypothetical protein
MRKPTFVASSLLMMLALPAGCGGPHGPSAETDDPLTIVVHPPPKPIAVAGMLESKPPEMFVAESNGAVRRAVVDWSLQGHGGEGWFDSFNGVRSLAAWTSRFDRSRHLVVLDNAGDVRVDQFLERGPTTQRVLGNVANGVLVAGYGVGWNDPFDHVFVAGSDGNIREFDFVDGSSSVDVQPPCANFGPLLSLTAFYNWTEQTGHLVAVTTRGAVYDVHIDPVLRRQGAFTTDFIGVLPGVAYAAGFAGPDGRNHLMWTTSAGSATELLFGNGAPNQSQSLPGSLGNVSAFGVVPTDAGYGTVVGIGGNSVTMLAGTFAVYNQLFGEPSQLFPSLASAPDLEIEVDFCLTDDNRAKMQDAVQGAIGKISNAQVKAYFASAAFHSQCVSGHERGGIYAFDTSATSRSMGWSYDAPRLAQGHTLAFTLKSNLLRDLTASVWKEVQQQPHAVSLDNYTLSLDSAPRNQVSLHVDATYTLYGIPIPLGASYTDAVTTDADGKLQCQTDKSVGAPDEPTVGCLAAQALPATVPFGSVTAPVEYRVVDISSAGGFYVEAVLF